MTYRIAHIADVHLDMKFEGADAAVGHRRREQLRESFERALHLARDRGADALCVAGDLYEAGRAGPDRATYLRRCFAELAPMRVFLAPGNHDPLTSTSVYAQMAPLPENVHVFQSRSFTAVALADSLTLWGFAHQHPADREAAMSGFRCDGPGVHLMLFHGSDRDRMPPGKESVAPFTGSQIEAAGAAHAMVGHFHDMLAGARHAYPGSPEPHNFSQGGRHTASLVTIEDGRVSTDFVDINRTRYCELDFDVSPYGDKAAVAEALAARLESSAAPPALVYWRVRLVGELQRTLEFDAAQLQADLGDRFGGLTLVEAYSAFDYDAILQGERRTVRSEFVRELRRRIDEASPEERPLLDLALRYGMLAFAKKPLPL